MSLGDAIRARRRQLGLTQTALGLKMWPKTAVSNAGTRIKRFEAGQKPKVHELDLLAKCLEIDPAELLEAEWGPGWSQEVVDGGIIVKRSVLEHYPNLRGYIEALNVSMENGLTDVADHILETMCKQGQLKAKKVTPPKKGKA